MTGPRLRDVADRASVSMTTASIVLRRLPGARISPQTRARVHLAADELGYRPRERNREVRFAAVALDPDASLEALRLLTAAVDAAWRGDHLVVVIPAGDDVLDAGNALLHDAALQIDGLVHVDPPYAVEPPPHLFERTVVVRLGNPVAHEAGGWAVVVPDDSGAARKVGEALAGAGHRRVAVVAGEAEAPIAAWWREGLADGLKASRETIPIVDPAGKELFPAPTPGEPGVDPVITALVCMSARSAEAWARLGSEGRLNVALDSVTLVRGGPLPADGVLPGAVMWLPLPTSELAQAALSAALEGPGRRVRAATGESAVVVVPFPLPPRLVLAGPVPGAARV
jgi:DNA-binding LacI/PurR family transcriptional regulator